MATSVALLQVVDNLHHKLGSRFSTGRLLTIEDCSSVVNCLDMSLLVVRFKPTKLICVYNKDKPWIDVQCRQGRLIFVAFLYAIIYYYFFHVV